MKEHHAAAGQALPRREDVRGERPTDRPAGVPQLNQALSGVGRLQRGDVREQPVQLARLLQGECSADGVATQGLVGLCMQGMGSGAELQGFPRLRER